MAEPSGNKRKNNGLEIEKNNPDALGTEEEQKRLVAQVHRAQKLESIGRLAGGIAHDFNNMLSIINGYAEIVLEELDPTEEMAHRVQEILDAGRRSAGLVRQLLAFARQQHVQPVLMDINRTVDATTRMLQRLIGEDIDLEWRPGSNLMQVAIDPGQVDQILANLVVNAREAIRDVGKMTIETENVVIDDDDCRNEDFRPGLYIRLSVSDNGCGIDPESLGRIFDPFYTTKPRDQGTGLGLSTVYGIVRQNNGWITVYSEPGSGTTFRVYLPAVPGPEGHFADENVPEPVPRGSGKLLVVEDDPQLLELFKKRLESLGYSVVSASCPEAAIEAAAQHGGKFDLLITDVIMPGMNGRDLAKRLCGLYPGFETLYMSGYTADAISRHGILEPGVAFIGKPFSTIDMARKIREILTAS